MGLDDSPGRRAARWYGRMAEFYRRRASELRHQADRSDAWAMREVLIEGAERAERYSEWCSRAMLAEMSAEDIDAAS